MEIEKIISDWNRETTGGLTIDEVKEISKTHKLGVSDEEIDFYLMKLFCVDVSLICDDVAIGILKRDSIEEIGNVLNDTRDHLGAVDWNLVRRPPNITADMFAFLGPFGS